MANKKKESFAKKDTAIKPKDTAVTAAQEVKEPVKETPAKAEPAKEVTAKEAPVKETLVKKAAKSLAAKTSKAPKAPAAPKAPKKAVLKESSFVEFEGKQLSVSEITENAKKHWQASNNGVISDIKVYINTNQSKAFYVVNNEDRGEFDI